MPCSITIAQVVGFPAAAGPNIQITGTATECPSVVLTVGCSGAPAPVSGTFTVDASGHWVGQFIEVAGCQCGGSIQVRAQCSSNPACNTVFTGILSCGENCPAVSVTVTQGDCHNGVRDVTLTANITPAGPGQVNTEWDFGDGNSSTGTWGNTNTVTHGYSPGDYTAQLLINSIMGCPPTPTPPFHVAECDCPEVANLTVTVAGCAGAGNTAAAAFTGSFPGSTQGCQFQWDFGDGSPEVITATPNASHAYTAPGTFAASVVTHCGECIRSTTVTVDVPGCCPGVTAVLVSPVQGCAGDGNLASFNFTATTAPANAPGTYTWEFGDGTPPQTTNTPTTTHAFANDGNFNVTVVYSSGLPQCGTTTASTPVNVPRCPPPPPPEKPESFSCIGLRWLIVLTFIFAFLSLFIGLCIPGAGTGFLIAAGGLAIAGAILLVIWLLICPQPCAWGLLLSWEILLGAGIGALYLAPCCPQLWIIGAVAVLAAVGLLAAWVRQCNETRCDVIRELLLVIVAVIIPVFGWVRNIPLLALCVSPVLDTILAALAGVLGALAAGCISSSRLRIAGGGSRAARNRSSCC
jgi:PKD domain